MGHFFHIAFVAQEIGFEKSDTKGGEKQQQRGDTKPLNAVDRLQKIFVHEWSIR